MADEDTPLLGNVVVGGNGPNDLPATSIQRRPAEPAQQPIEPRVQSLPISPADARAMAAGGGEEAGRPGNLQASTAPMKRTVSYHEAMAKATDTDTVRPSRKNPFVPSSFRHKYYSRLRILPPVQDTGWTIVGSVVAMQEVIGQSSVGSSIVVLANTCIGAGVLAIPFALKSTGLVLGLLLLTTIALMSMYSFYLLNVTRSASGKRSYAAIAQHYFGTPGLVTVQISLVLLLVGAAIIYLDLLADSLSPLIAEYLPASAWLERKPLLCYILVLVYPLTLAKELRPLRHTSMVALLCLVYLLVVITIRLIGWEVWGIDPRNTTRIISGGSTRHMWGAVSGGVGAIGDPIGAQSQEVGSSASGSLEEENTVPLAVFASSFFLALPIQAVAFNGQFSGVQIINELKDPTPGRALAVPIGAVTVCFMFYSAFGVVGLLTFGELTPGDLLTLYAQDDVLLNVGRLALAVVLLFSYPLFFLPLRETLYEILQAASGRTEYPWYVKVVMTTVSNLLCLVVAVVVPSLQNMLSLVGASTGMLIASKRGRLIKFWTSVCWPPNVRLDFCD